MQRKCSDISACAKTALTVLVLSVVPPAAAFAQSAPSITWSTDTTKIRIGEQIELGIEVRAPKDAIVAFPELQFKSDSMEVVRRSKIDTAYKKGEAVYSISYYLTSFEKGKYTVPPIPVKAGNDTLSTEAFRVDVATVPVDTLKQARYGIKDIRTDSYTPGELFRKYYWLLIVLAVAGLLAWEIWRIAKRRRARKLPPEMLLSPYERAKFRLGRLDGEKLIEQGRIKDFYIELTDVIRFYLDEQYGIPAPENTTEQTLREVRKLKLDKEQYGKLRELLLDADLVKFAKMFPSGEENDRYRRYTEEIIDHLQPVTEPAGTSPIGKRKEEENVGE